MKALFLLIGVAALAAGLLFMGQGLGYIRWPASSFMISQIRWAYYGAGIAAVGVVLIIAAKR
jgi:bacteriorhodopsin